MHALSAPTRDDLSTRVRVLVSLATLYLVWSSTYLALRHLVAAAPPMLSGGARFLVAGGMLFALQRARGESAPERRTWGAAAVSGVLLFTLGNGLLSLAETRVGSGVAAVAYAATPLLVTALSALGGERPRARELVGIALGFAGVAALGASSDILSAGVRGLLLLVAPFVWAVGTVVARKARPASSVTFAAQQMVCGGLTMLFVGGALGERIPPSLPTDAWVALAYLTLFGSVLAFPAYGYLVQNARPAVATSYAYVNPVLAVLLGAALGGETVTTTTLVALALVVTAVLTVASARTSAVSSRSAKATGGSPAGSRTAGHSCSAGSSRSAALRA